MRGPLGGPNARDTQSPGELAVGFAEAVMAQWACIEQGNAREGNRYAKKYDALGRQLLAGGEASIEVFCSLLSHCNRHVLVMAAAYLLKSRTERAVVALRPIAVGRDMAALGAKMTLERYERGELD
jgi:hypothetical protein